ncbi:sigma factor-like helix-turn-helix DNA-binding protein [Micromonospora sp. CB01531]|uniref:sigma factor-like helix-turn-helix DNA-binding protein n=1 Tax=Micromonospora sp. CB01531 TaxID=1718947 RepID=UPI000960AD08|nr:sigma factor-like helix-turn-helix DNA-binding protein [Micromonospora sp. CB01531]OKI45135.1 hypothetical protein A6A27_12030 [Micromonospora sp. CB01531]
MEQLLPGVWDSDYAYGMENPEAPRPVTGCSVHARRDGSPREDCACCDPSGRKATTNPKRGNTHYAHLADIHAAWRHGQLTLKERRAVFMRYGLGLTQREIGLHEGITKQSAEERISRGVGRLVAHLNGDECESDSEESNTP